MNAPLRVPAVAPADLRRAASRFPTGVALVTSPGDDALIVDSFVSVSLEPPLIAFCPGRASLTWRRMRRRGRPTTTVREFPDEQRERHEEKPEQIRPGEGHGEGNSKSKKSRRQRDLKGRKIAKMPARDRRGIFRLRFIWRLNIGV